MQLELLDKLADENVAELFLGRLECPGGPQLVSVRRLLRQVASVPGVLDALEEASQQARQIRHGHLLSHLAFVSSGGDHYWINARTLGFDLETVLIRLASREVRITPLRVLQIGVDFIEGLAAIHARGLVHGGLDPRQVVVDFGDGYSRLDGVGYEAALMRIKDIKQRVRRGRSASLPPEVLQGREGTQAADVFSAAAILYLMLTGRQPLGEMRGGTVSTRHAAVLPPSKLERSLPYSCDAVFVKALAISPRGRHESGASLCLALSTLRKSLVQGADEARRGVCDFISHLYPNEANVAGMPGSRDRPATSPPIEIDARIDASAWQEATEPAAFPSAAEEPTAPAVAFSPPPARRQPIRRGELQDDSDWVYEPLEGGGPDAGDQADAARPRTGAVPVHDTEEMRAASVPSLARELGPDARTEVGPPRALHSDTEVMPAVIPREDEIEPAEMADASTIHSAPSPEDGEAPGQGSLWRRPSTLIAVSLCAMVLVFSLLYLMGGLSSDPEVAPSGPPSDAASFIGFLSVGAEPGARVILDGEVLPGQTPLKRYVVKAGRHRLVVKGSDKVLVKRTVEIKAGEHMQVQVPEGGAESSSGQTAPADKPSQPSADDEPDPMRQVDDILSKPPQQVRKKTKKTKKTKKSRRRHRQRKSHKPKSKREVRKK
ncbi:MAG: protein kinase [Deltaproteobacteria bacterium]|nr:protein kinase [Deltaproteobacteria bacterium]